MVFRCLQPWVLKSYFTGVDTNPLITQVKVRITGASILLLSWFPWGQHPQSLNTSLLLHRCSPSSVIMLFFVLSTSHLPPQFSSSNLSPPVLTPTLFPTLIPSEASSPSAAQTTRFPWSSQQQPFTDRGRVHYRRPNSANNVLYEKHLLTHTQTDVPNTLHTFTHTQSF